jgi:hypothetical protein
MPIKKKQRKSDQIEVINISMPAFLKGEEHGKNPKTCQAHVLAMFCPFLTTKSPSRLTVKVLSHEFLALNCFSKRFFSRY